MNVRNRITEVQRVRFGDVRAHPGNYRRHPKTQQAALRGVVDEVGFATVPLAYHSERNGGALTWLDGHLRSEAFPDYEGDVAILDVNDTEAALLLATLDPIAAMATHDAEALDALLRDVQTSDAAVQEMIAGLAGEAGLYQEPEPYTTKIASPVYQPSGKEWKIADLFDDTKTRALLEAIDASDLPQEQKEFLAVAARRHTVLRFDRIADVYAEAIPAFQRLMEDSALVIIDFDRAFELGYVKLTQKVSDLYEATHGAA